LRSLSYGQQLQHGSSALGQMAPVAEKLIAYRDEFARDAAPQGTIDLERIDRLELDRVSFAYTDHDPVLRDVSLAISRGDVVGVVGPSGAGKTTLVQLVLGLLHPTAGSVRVDGHALTDVANTSWHRLVTYVPQDTRLVDGTIADNVRFSRPHISDDDVRAALAGANLGLDTDRFPLGIDTPLGASGHQLSGGQRQRLSIARSLVTRPSIVVLDEPTSALDSESEEIVTDTLSRLRGNTAVIVVTHRDSTLSVCDRVIDVRDGAVAERL
jgi:ABC-type bacteriocin/lantibiotic exporter with double-glycine peptidase domain